MLVLAQSLKGSGFYVSALTSSSHAKYNNVAGRVAIHQEAFSLD